MYKLDNLEQYEKEDCPFTDRCPLADGDPECERYYIDCPRFIDYIIADAKSIIKEKDKKNYY